MKEKLRTVTDEPASFNGDEVIDVSAEEVQNPSSLEPIDPQIREKALELYMGHTSYGAICNHLNIKLPTLKAWVTRGQWSAKRKETDALMFSEVMESKKYLLNDIVSKMMTLVGDCLDKQFKEGIKPKDLPTFFSSLASVEKLCRITHGMSTSISEERSKRANFTIPLEALRDANVVKIEDPFNDKKLSASDTGSGTENN